MTSLIFLALLNGVFIGLSRSLNGQLSQKKGPFKASFYNHLIGFLALSLLIISFNHSFVMSLPAWQIDTWYLYFGGLIGALYVALNSYVLNQLGAMKAALLVISGQMLTGLIIDWGLLNSTLNLFDLSGLLPLLMQISGVVLIILGIALSQKKPTYQAKSILAPKTSSH